VVDCRETSDRAKLEFDDENGSNTVRTDLSPWPNLLRVNPVLNHSMNGELYSKLPKVVALGLLTSGCLLEVPDSEFGDSFGFDVGTGGGFDEFGEPKYPSSASASATSSGSPPSMTTFGSFSVGDDGVFDSGFDDGDDGKPRDSYSSTTSFDPTFGMEVTSFGSFTTFDPSFGEGEVSFGSFTTFIDGSSSGFFDEGEVDEGNISAGEGGEDSACCTPQYGGGCGDYEIESCVCAYDRFCCLSQWDEVCVEEVSSLGCGVCDGGGGGDDTGDPGDGGIPRGDVRFGLIENNVDALDAFTLEEVLDAVAEGTSLTGLDLYRNLIDIQASEPNGILSGVQHCTGEINGFPIACDRLEVEQFNNLEQWFANAVINRIDLAPTDGSNCGQQRIIFANNAFIGNGRMFIILEAEIPNPNPECGVGACQPLVEFWNEVSTFPAAERGQRLREAFVFGDPSLPQFGRFMTAQALAPETGQIRTNNFNDSPWTLREFKIVEGSTRPLEIRSFPTADAPPAVLWSDDAGPLGDFCQAAFLDVLPNLLTDNPAAWSFPIPAECNDAESRNDFFSQVYPFALGENFSDAIADRLDDLGNSLTPFDVAARAQFTGSCIGCHEESNFQDLGDGISAPPSNGFVQVTEFFTDGCPEGGECRPLSEALTSSFLPTRREATELLLSQPSCGDGGGEPEPVILFASQSRRANTLPGLRTLGGQSALVSH